MNFKIILTIAFFIILISIQFTLNLILKEIRMIKKIAIKDKESEAVNRANGWGNRANNQEFFKRD